MNALKLWNHTMLCTLVLTLLGSALAIAAPGDTQKNSAGGVTVTVSYTNPRKPEAPRFRVVLDTHSVDLTGYDLKTIAFLRDEKGNIHSPAAIENKGSGHHRQSEITFPNLPTGVKRVELVIRDVGGVKERIFRWTRQ